MLSIKLYVGKSGTLGSAEKDRPLLYLNWFFQADCCILMFRLKRCYHAES